MRPIDKFLKNAKENDVAVDSIIIEDIGGGIQESREVNKIDLHELRSCSKILVAMAIGIAIEEKFVCLNGKPITLSTKVLPTFLKLTDVKPQKEASEWTIKTLLTLSTGFEKMMLNSKSVGGLDKNHLIDFVLSTPLKYKPNTHFTYSNVEPYLLSVFFQENFGLSLADFVNERIFKPLGIEKFVWNEWGKYTAGATGMFLNFKDFHKLAKLLYDFGKFDGKQIVPEKWVREMARPQFDCPEYFKKERLYPKVAAGYFTWISNDDVVFRDGNNGQYLILDRHNERIISIMATQKEMAGVTECLRNIFD